MGVGVLSSLSPSAGLRRGSWDSNPSPGHSNPHMQREASTPQHNSPAREAAKGSFNVSECTAEGSAGLDRDTTKDKEASPLDAAPPELTPAAGGEEDKDHSASEAEEAKGENGIVRGTSLSSIAEEREQREIAASVSSEDCHGECQYASLGLRL